jgi:hypothetical protein
MGRQDYTPSLAILLIFIGAHDWLETSHLLPWKKGSYRERKRLSFAFFLVADSLITSEPQSFFFLNDLFRISNLTPLETKFDSSSL